MVKRVGPVWPKTSWTRHHTFGLMQIYYVNSIDIGAGETVS